MERSPIQPPESDKDKKADNEKKGKSGSTDKAARLFMRLQSGGEGILKADRPVEKKLRKKLAFIAGEYTELSDGKSEKTSASAEIRGVRKKNDEKPIATENIVTAREESISEHERQEATDGFVEVRPADAKKERPQTITEAEETEEADDVEVLPEQELPPKAFWVGKAIDLSSSAEEHVVLLHDEPANETVPAEIHEAVDVPGDQPEQQHEVYGEESVAEPEPPVPGGGEVPPIKPPEDTGEAFGEPEEPEPEPPVFRRPELVAPDRPEPAQVYRAYMQRQAVAQHMQLQQSGQPGVTKRELDDAVYRAAKHGQNRGLLTGLLVGGAYEHFKHKRREKKAEKRAKEQRKQLEAARRDYRFGLEQQERQQSELHARLGATERRVISAENRLAEQPPRPPETAPQPAQQPEQASVAPPEQLVVPPEHRLETSAWLSTEIDKKTGRVVEQPSFQYGREYYRERAQETLPAQHRHAAAGGVALIGASGGAGGQSTSGSSSLLQPQIPSATMQGDPSQLHTRQATNASQRKLSESLANAAPLWPWVLALIGIIIVLVVVLR